MAKVTCIPLETALPSQRWDLSGAGEIWLVPSGNAEQGQWTSASRHLCDRGRGAHTLQRMVSFICDALQVTDIKYIFEHNVFNLMMGFTKTNHRKV